MPLPIGLFDAVFLIGGCLGRLSGTIIQDMALTGLSFEPWEIAIAGAVFFSSGVTHTLAPAVVVYELAGARMTSLPLCLGTYIALTISSKFSKSIYDNLIKSKDIPFLPDLQEEAASVPVFRLMTFNAQLPILTLTTTFQEAKDLLAEFPGHSTICPSIPVVDSLEELHLVGSVSWDHLNRAMTKFDEAIKNGVMLTPASQPYKKSNSYGFDLTSAAKDQSNDLFDTHFFKVEDFLSNDDDDDDGHRSTMTSENSEAYLNSPAPSTYLDVVSPLSPESLESPDLEAGAGSPKYLPPTSRPVLNYEKKGSFRYTPPPRDPRLTPSPARGSKLSPDRKKLLRKQPAGSKQSLFVSTKTTKINIPASTRLFFVILKERESFVPVSASSNSALYVIESITIPLNPAPYQTLHTTELGQLDYIFRMLKLNVAFVTRCGRLEGALTREALRQFTVAYTKDPLQESLRFCGALANNLKIC
eukprot:CAMPEP_0117747822 /NCGR_PEP_ID=MMETSP0947-20121206/8723_1 /TAXON_ID=44440 /ORGANISM="Chattonella subsalsa, Strain CCMP2191" /LENGTH=472 /DNA_ID=CAMNT_0005565315 /DNA_START=234 /DNA_END=1653 /DNA_ORIENTATION=-